MVEPTGHCPYLGLKQNRAIRFASPTPEHRCYVGGEPIEIPVDQASYCLSQGHVHCPLYMGLSLPTTNDAAPTVVESALVAPGSGFRGWLASLSRRDRLIYTIMLVMLAAIILIYLLAGLQAFLRPPSSFGSDTATSAAPTAQPVAGLATSAPTVAPATPTDIPTSTPSPQPTAQPTRPALILLPTQAPSSPPASPTRATVSISATSTLPSATPALATQAPAPTAQTTPGGATNTQTLMLYFADPTGRLYVPVERRAVVENNEPARAAIREMIAGPRNGLGRLLLPDARLLDLRIGDGTATVNFDRRPTSAGDDRGLYAIVFSLTHLPDIQRVQFQVNGQNIGVNGTGPIARPTLNPINPDNLPFDVKQTEFLPLYFVAADGQHDIRVIRMVPKTSQVATATVRALIAGPEDYGFALQRVIPKGTELRGIRLENGIITVDFTQPFAGAANRAAAVRTVAESLTTLPTVHGVIFLVEGRSLGDLWGQDYAGVFGRQLINAE